MFRKMRAAYRQSKILAANLPSRDDIARLSQSIVESIVPHIGHISDNNTKAKWGLTGRTVANPLTVPARKYWSQADEDGIIENILRRLPGTVAKTFVEIGVGDGSENNSVVLLSRGWEGLWFGGEDLCFEPAKNGLLTFHKVWISLEKFASVTNPLMEFSNKHGLGLLSIDLDGNDYFFLEAILEAGARPDILVAEYNARLPADVEWVMPYTPDHTWDGSDYYGMSLQSTCNLAATYDYVPVATSAQGANVIFVLKKHMKLFADVPTDVHDLYMPPDFDLLTVWGHPTSPALLESLTRRKS
ncbi:unannotated protein [freshwater metagenome]|uniref:Unannotated protein n=1 Tax=freshwater metagenome TaxID=449393 RepID=A0A6J7GTU7_9ZZZZ